MASRNVSDGRLAFLLMAPAGSGKAGSGPGLAQELQ
jgi:hypothetical protein